MGDKRVSRMAAVLVLAAGGEIRIPKWMIGEADFIELEQDDREPGFVVYRARQRNYSTNKTRLEEGNIIDGDAVVVENMKRISDANRENGMTPEEKRFYDSVVDGLRRSGWTKQEAEGEALDRLDRRRNGNG